MKAQVIASAWELMWWKKGETGGANKVTPEIQSIQGQGKENPKALKLVSAGVPQSPRGHALEAVMEAMSDWCPVGQVKVKDAASTLVLNIPAPAEVWPTLREKYEGNAGQRNVKKMISATVTRDDIPLTNYSVVISAKMILPSGGHEHSTQPSQDLLGEFRDIQTNATGKGTITTVTDEEGKIKLDFTAPEFSGQLQIMATSTTEEAEDNKELVVRVPNLVEVGESNDYYLTGKVTGKHTVNHFFCSQTAITELVKAAKEFKRSKWNTTGRMQLNDMTLEWGGLFDLDGNWSNKDGHDSHRIGRSVDIGNLELETIKKKSPLTGKDTTVTKPKVKWVNQFKTFMETQMKNWKFVAEGQTNEDIFDRTKRFPHFEWKGN
jgi:hypothetical protein